MASYRLPFFADAGSLPATLPTVHDIESAEEIFGDTTGRKVVGVGPHFVVKYGVQIDPLEGQTIMFLAQSTLIPIPRVYAVYRNSAQDTTYIVMERVKGSSLVLEWPKMDRASKEAVAIQLRSVFGELRRLPSPGGYCSVDRQRLLDGLFWTDDPTSPHAGPFDTEAELNSAMVLKYTENGLSKHKASYYTRAFADSQRKNILVCNPETLQDGVRPELVIVDWEYSGWYPSYWEYARAIFAGGRWDDDWNDWVDEILEPFRNEYAWVEMLLRELWS